MDIRNVHAEADTGRAQGPDQKTRSPCRRRVPSSARLAKGKRISSIATGSAVRSTSCRLDRGPSWSLKGARTKHKLLVADVAKKIDPRAAKAAAPMAVPTFGDMVDAYVQTHEATWRNAKHRYQWRQTLTDYCGPIRGLPVDQIATSDVLTLLKPLWGRAPETASRLRGRIQAVIEAAQAHRPHRRGQGQPSALEGPFGPLAGATEEARCAWTSQSDALRSVARVRELCAPPTTWRHSR